ncbi:hypothetical protein A0H81_00807 [Grifola frondosa]|uniref:Uncharacterized protein n=1 Tax=Grifola frondosa TaxID=5627 RepID=A0A1C7MWP3_GRIFR|nr:hypothetical protein A0H81_00807 [Grifola frondosa]
MSEKTARSHTAPSNRASTHSSIDRKVVFRSVVDNPFRVQWPVVPVNVQNAILARVLDMLQGVSEYYINREKDSRKRKLSHKGHNTGTFKKYKADSTDDAGMGGRPFGGAATSEGHPAGPEPTATAAESYILSATPPTVLEHLTVGINEVTKELEKVTRSLRQEVTAQNNVASAKSPSESTSRMVIICRADVDPPVLIDHIPHLVALCNSPRQGHDTSSMSTCNTWLVPLPKGAENSLAEAMGLRRVSVMLIDGDAPNFSAFTPLLESVPILNAPWLTLQVSDRPLSHVPTHIKQLRTTAPKDMKAAKEQRVRGRAAAKAAARERGA